MTALNWNLEPPPGFQGLDAYKPIQIYWRHMPHWRQDGATYFVTFRLADSLPHSMLEALRSITREWQALRVTMRTEESWAEFYDREMQKVEGWLDRGLGECYLRRPEISAVVQESLLHLDGERCEVGCFVVMPNHVHALIRPLIPAVYPLEHLLQVSKGFTARKANRVLDRSGIFWQEESYDRIVRDEEHLYNVIQYIGRNARFANLAEHEVVRWIRPSWVVRGWDFHP
ncbi:MAG: transposase [Pirellulaceae bacterium]